MVTDSSLYASEPETCAITIVDKFETFLLFSRVTGRDETLSLHAVHWNAKKIRRLPVLFVRWYKKVLDCRLA